MKAKYKEQNNLSISRRNFMKNTALLGTGLAFAPAQLAFAQQNTLMTASTMTDKERMAWFKDARFGLFLHWGLYSLLGRGTWAMFIDQISVPEMKKLARQFNPDKYNPNEWAELALEAGMRYAVLTTRHHDGFCLFDSKVSDFTSVETAAKRDLVAEYVEAFRKAGLKVGFYYSLVDWRGDTGYGKFILGFDYDKTDGTNTTMKAEADNCKNKDPDGGRKLDGSRVQPNADDKEWSY